MRPPARPRAAPCQRTPRRAGHDCGLYLIAIAQALCGEALEAAEGKPLRAPAESPAAVLALTPAAVDKKRAQMLGLVEAYAPPSAG